MKKPPSRTPVSKDLQQVLDHIAGIPKGKEKEALRIQSAGLAISPNAIGIWVGSCYYVKNGPVQGIHGTYTIVECIA
jgi:hypothetical protein